MFPVDHKLLSTVLPAPISLLLQEKSFCQKVSHRSLSHRYLIDLSHHHLSSISLVVISHLNPPTTQQLT